MGVDVDEENLRKHGVSPVDARCAATTQMIIAYPLGEDPVRELVLGWDTQARLLELVVLTRSDGSMKIIHAMPARPQYIDLLPWKES